MATKGGARRCSVEPVDIDALQGIFDRAVSARVTTRKKATTAVSAAGLHRNAEYVREICKISSGEIVAGQLKQCIVKYAYSHNTSEWKDDLWAGKIASQLVCLLSHVRRLRREPDKLRQCLQGATGVQRQTIQELEHDAEACKKAKRSSSASAGVAKACKKAKKASSASSEQSHNPEDVSSSSAPQVAQAGKRARSLKQQISDVSVDSRGWPRILASPKFEKEGQSPTQAEEQSMHILEKKRDSFRKQLEKAAHSAAQDYDWDDDAWTGREAEQWDREWDHEINRRSRGWTQTDDDSSDNSLRRGDREVARSAARWVRKENRSSEEDDDKEKKEAARKEFGPSLQESAKMAQAGLKEGPKAKAKNAPKAAAGSSSSSRPERRPEFVPEHRPGEADWDPFWQEARGEKTRESRKQQRLQNPDVQEKKAMDDDGDQKKEKKAKKKDKKGKSRKKEETKKDEVQDASRKVKEESPEKEKAQEETAEAAEKPKEVDAKDL
eukprot:s1868_g6.t1